MSNLFNLYSISILIRKSINLLSSLDFLLSTYEVLHKKLKELFSAIEIYEKSDYSKRNEFNKLDTFKDFIKHFIRDMERKTTNII